MLPTDVSSREYGAKWVHETYLPERWRRYQKWLVRFAFGQPGLHGCIVRSTDYSYRVTYITEGKRATNTFDSDKQHCMDGGEKEAPGIG